MPLKGWHQLPNGVCAHVVPDKYVYQVRYFPVGTITADNYEKVGRQSERMAAAVFGTKGPAPSPEPPEPMDRKGKRKATEESEDAPQKTRFCWSPSDGSKPE
jgi:hypothetical protein